MTGPELYAKMCEARAIEWTSFKYIIYTIENDLKRGERPTWDLPALCKEFRKRLQNLEKQLCAWEKQVSDSETIGSKEQT